MKYKAGDIVMVRGDLCGGTRYDGIYVNYDMLKYSNLFLTIQSIGKTGDGNVQFYRVQENTWVWTDGMFSSHINRDEDIGDIDYDMFMEVLCENTGRWRTG